MSMHVLASLLHCTNTTLPPFIHHHQHHIATLHPSSPTPHCHPSSIITNTTLPPFIHHHQHHIATLHPSSPTPHCHPSSIITNTTLPPFIHHHQHHIATLHPSSPTPHCHLCHHITVMTLLKRGHLVHVSLCSSQLCILLLKSVVIITLDNLHMSHMHQHIHTSHWHFGHQTPPSVPH